MEFPDYKFVSSSTKDDEQSAKFVHHSEVLAYIKSYAEYFGVNKHVKLNSKIASVEYTQEKTWMLDIENTETKSKKSKEFDKLIVANGHYSKPNYGFGEELLKTFSGKLLHSHHYRSEESLLDLQHVTVVGLGPSGIDIAVELYNAGKNVTCLVRKSGGSWKYKKLPFDVVEGIDSIDGNILKTSDGDEIRCDALILATGYDYDFKFLQRIEGLDMKYSEQYVRNLWQHCLPINNEFFNKLAFVAVPSKIVPFPIMDHQMRLVLESWYGVNKDEIKRNVAKDLEEENNIRKTMRNADKHRMIDGLMWTYFEKLDSIIGSENLPSWLLEQRKLMKDLYLAAHKNRIADPVNYKSIPIPYSE